VENDGRRKVVLREFLSESIFWEGSGRNFRGVFLLLGFGDGLRREFPSLAAQRRDCWKRGSASERLPDLVFSRACVWLLGSQEDSGDRF